MTTNLREWRHILKLRTDKSAHPEMRQIMRPLLDELNRKAMFFKYANKYAAANDTLPDNFEVTDRHIEDFENFLKEKNFKCEEEGEVKLTELRKIAADSRYDKSFSEGIDKLDAMLKQYKERQIRRYADEVRDALRTEILARMKGEKARFESNFARDKQLRAAVKIIQDKKIYNRLLGIKEK